MISPITALYVPGNRPDRFDKAVDSGADLVIVDLEDAVPLAEKAAARENVVRWLESRGNDGVEVRVNAGDDDDLAALRPLGVAIRVPKVESPADVPDGFAVTAMIETTVGVERAFAIATHPGVVGLALGEADLASDLGSGSSVALDYARSRILFAARAAGLPAPMVSVYPNIEDLDGLRADTLRGKDLGLVGRTAVHPKQLEVIREVFAYTDAQRAWASEVLEVMQNGGVATLASGEMVDPAMVGLAKRILEQ